MGIVLQVIIPLVSLFIGGLITWAVSHHHFEEASRQLKEEAEAARQMAEKATKELKKETDLLKRSTRLMLKGLEKANFIRVNWDPEGNPVGEIIDLTASIKEPVSMSEAVEVEMK